MKAGVTEECIACNLCVDAVPEVFQMDDEANIAKVIADPVPPEHEEKTREAAAACPTEAITIEE